MCSTGGPLGILERDWQNEAEKKGFRDDTVLLVMAEEHTSIAAAEQHDFVPEQNPYN